MAPKSKRPPYKAIRKTPVHRVTGYDTFTMFIIDDVARDGSNDGGGGDQVHIVHEHKCDKIHELFDTCVEDCKFVSVRFPRHAKEVQFRQFFTQQLTQRGPEDFVFVYFHGTAGGNGEDYFWNFIGPGPRRINAYSFVKQLNASNVDCQLVLDCFMPTRFARKWRRETHMTEIFQSGKNYPDVPGLVAPKDPKEYDFTESFYRRMKAFINRLYPSPDNFRLEGRQTVLEVLGKDKELASNPLRIWLNKTKRGSERLVKRFVIEPEAVRQSGQIRMFACEIQGPGNTDDDDGDYRNHIGNGRGGGDHGGGSGENADNTNSDHGEENSDDKAIDRDTQDGDGNYHPDPQNDPEVKPPPSPAISIKSDHSEVVFPKPGSSALSLAILGLEKKRPRQQHVWVLDDDEAPPAKRLRETIDLTETSSDVTKWVGTTSGSPVDLTDETDDDAAWARGRREGSGLFVELD